MRTADPDTDTSDLVELDDPGFITHWAAVRRKLALTSRDDPEHAEVKRAYDLALSEYRRRIAGEAAA
jgi:hypothetical protein